MKVLAPALSRLRLPVICPEKKVAGLTRDNVAADALLLVTMPAFAAKNPPVVLVTRATAWLLPLRSTVPELTTRS